MVHNRDFVEKTAKKTVNRSESISSPTKRCANNNRLINSSKIYNNPSTEQFVSYNYLLPFAYQLKKFNLKTCRKNVDNYCKNEF